MHAGVEGTDCPDGTEPGEHESPSRWPSGKVLALGEDVVCVVAFAGEMLSDGKGDDGGDDENDVHCNEDGLQLSHDLGESGGQDTVEQDTAEEDGVDYSVTGGPVSITCNDNTGGCQWKQAFGGVGDLHRAEHQGESIVNAAKPTDQTQAVRIPNQEAQSVSGLRRREVMCP